MLLCFKKNVFKSKVVWSGDKKLSPQVNRLKSKALSQVEESALVTFLCVLARGMTRLFGV